MLTNADEIARCIPYAESVEVYDSRLRAKLRPPLSFIKGRLSIESEIVEMDEERSSLRLSIKGRSIGSSFDSSVAISIAGDELHASIVADTHGLLSTIPRSLVQKVIDDSWADFIRCIKGAMEGAGGR